MADIHRDCRGLALTAASPEAVEAWDRTVRSYLGMRRDTGDRLKEAYAADADMAMAHCLRGYFMLLFSEAGRWSAGRKSLAKAQKAAADRPVTVRETGHIAALERWADGDMAGATALWDGILTDHPHDLLAMRLAHYTHFYSGDSTAMRDSLARIMHAWDPTVPDYGFVAGCYAFALEEDGDYARAEQRGREAVGINPDDPWGTHAVAHVMEMQGRQAEGIAWLSGLEPHWSQVQNFRFHLWWHRALFHLELGDYDAVLDLYDRGVREEESADYLDLTNAVALLWRLESEGVDVGDRWREVAGHCAEHAT
ncbi:MAG: tetratricopeptide repeat protein, partial [Rhodospirillaceae bacterium]|nr:tetratricopeptide repeat protein [Rhodospirillaceae bacterium]